MSVRQLDPPQRKAWLSILPPDRQADRLLRDYLAARLEGADRNERAIIRAFLRAVDAVCVDGNPLSIRVKARKGTEHNSVEIFAGTSGPGRIEWLPAIVTKATDALLHIMRETSPFRILHAQDQAASPKSAPWDDRRRPIPPAVETRLVPGRPI